MLNASSLMRIATCMAACGLALLIAPAARSQTINVSLNVHYATPSNVNSGGTWEIVAKSSHSGIAGLNLRVTNINAAAVNEGPRGTVNGSDDAGFTLDVFPLVSGYRTVSANQFPVFAMGAEEESAFYGVGTIPNGEPGDLGPAFTSLTNVQDVPWATGTVGLDLPNPGNWLNAATFASGTFPINVTPGFAAGSTGSVFLAPGTSNDFGDVMMATLSTLVRTNFNPTITLPDYNENGTVDAPDYVVWRKGLLAADGNNNGMIDPGDYQLWVQHFGETSGSGGSLGGGNSAAVPEPAAAALLVLAAFCSVFYRRGGAIKPRPPVARSAGRVVATK